jgi:two-component system phosphate regulon sensor histidine kinase PhoR
VDGPLAIVAIAAAFLLAIGLLVSVRTVRAQRRTLREIDQLTADYAPDRDRLDRIRAVSTAAEQATADVDAGRRDLAVLIDLLGVGVIRLDARRRIEVANTAAHALLDREPGTLPGMTATAAFLDARLEAVVDTADSTGAASDEVRVASSDVVLVARAKRATPDGLWVLLEDVSELRRLQQIRAEFIDNLSHELRTPLTTVSLLAETLGRDATAAGEAVPARMRDRIDKIQVETGHLVQMVDELLDLSRIESGKRIVLLDDVDLRRLAAETAERLRLFAERQGVTIAVETSDPVPPVRGDADRLGQVLVNLLHNAVKFSHDGGVVTVAVQRDEARIVTSVEDRGVGIPKAAQARIFERFYKVDRARLRGAAGGTGLGLAIARNVIEQHGGTIWVESEEGRGATFSFALPIARTSS